MFVDGRDSAAEALRREIKIAKADHPSLLGVFEYDYDPASPPTDSDRLRLAALSHMEQLVFSIDEGGHETGDESNVGGNTAYLRDRSGRVRTAVFLRRAPGLDIEAMAYMNLAILFHELGHVDDFERGAHIVIGQELDLVAAELYAHRHACRLLRNRGYKLSLAFWLDGIEYTLSKCGVPNVEAAAKGMMELPEYAAIRASVAGIMAERFPQ